MFSRQLASELAIWRPIKSLKNVVATSSRDETLALSIALLPDRLQELSSGEG
jgi:hypothetical protein